MGKHQCPRSVDNHCSIVADIGVPIPVPNTLDVVLILSDVAQTEARHRFPVPAHRASSWSRISPPRTPKSHSDSQRRRPFIGHGALREDDSQRTLRSPLLTSPSGATNTSPTASIASQTHVNSSARSPPPTFLGFRHRHYANIRELRGKISRVPRFWLWPRFLNNSFFAKRLVFAGFLVSVALAWGVTVYNIKIIQWLIDFKTTNPDDFDNCRMVVVFSGLIYHMLPVAVLLFLPGSGLRSFEPFKRELLESNPATTTKENTNTDVNLEEGERGSTSVPKIKRRFVFQLCELLASVLWCAIYACGSYEMHLFTLGGAVCYVGLFIVIYYFARYREHIKMQLGAFTESDQTGDIRKHNLDLGRDRSDLQEMREILDYAQARGLTSSEFGFPRKNPVHVAAYHGNIRALELLEEYGFDMAALDKYNSVHFSTGSLFWYFARIFVKRPRVGRDVALTPFHLAAARNNVLAVRKFISRKTDVDCLGEMGYVGLNRRTPLHWAAISGSTEAVDALLKAGADPNFQDARVVRSLIRAGAEPNLADGEFMTPLMCAASALDVSRELFSELTTAGGDIVYQLPTTGDTALHIAVREENRSSALAALANGGDLMRMNSEGLRPLDCTASARLLFELKRAAGQRDVMISYTHSHLAFARKLRQSLEEANVTTWLDLMDPSGIGGGAVWREEIARGITNASVVLCILTEDYASSEWCLKELALAKQVGAIVDENLQVYLYTRQIIPFEPAIVGLRHDEGRIEYDYDESRYRSQFHLLLDGCVMSEKRRFFTKQKNVASSRNLDVDGNDGEGDAGSSSNARLSPVAGSWNAASSSSPSDLQEGQFVFLSHGDKHIPFVETLAAQLVEAGVACYSDRNVSGQDFNTRIQIAQETILRCSCFVVLVSRQTMGNELVRDQLAFAEDKSRPIFPIVLNDLNPGLDKRYSLGNVVGISTMGAMGP
ncbi:Ankyrin repeat-containing domain [Phytophthora cactorum]|nr:Ankyrin repeat-containing domain [Phytophthora cactorum]